MPIKPPGAPDYVCDDCGHTFLLSPLRVVAMLLRKRREIRCPKCGSKNVGMLTYCL